MPREAPQGFCNLLINFSPESGVQCSSDTLFASALFLLDRIKLLETIINSSGAELLAR